MYKNETSCEGYCQAEEESLASDMYQQAGKETIEQHFWLGSKQFWQTVGWKSSKNSIW